MIRVFCAIAVCGLALDANVCRPDDEPFCDVKV